MAKSLPPPPTPPSGDLDKLLDAALPMPEAPKARVELLAPVLFKFASDELEPVGVAMLHEVARELEKVLGEAEAVKLAWRPSLKAEVGEGEAATLLKLTEAGQRTSLKADKLARAVAFWEDGGFVWILLLGGGVALLVSELKKSRRRRS